MNAKRKPGGRPKMNEGKRTKKIDVRFTDDEYEIVLRLEDTLGVSKTELVRIRLLENAPAIIINAKELIAQLDSIGTEMSRCGNNINQLARYANTLQKQGMPDARIIQQFNELFKAYLKNQEKLETSLRNIIRSVRG